MPQPKKKHSNCRQGKRRASNFTLSAVNTKKCPECGALTLPHHLCPACGAYKGRIVKKPKEKKKGKEKA